jgi:hypothetical protein
MVYKNLTVADIGTNSYVHHIIITDFGRPQVPNPVAIDCPGVSTPKTCTAGQPIPLPPKPMPAASVFVGKGDEGGSMMFATKDKQVQSGFYIQSKDAILAQAEVVNYDDYDKEIYLNLDYEYTSGRPAGTLDVGMGAIDVSGCFKLPITPLTDRAQNFTSPPFTVTDDGYLINITPHLHDGGVNIKMFLNEEHVCTSEAVYGGSEGKTTVDGKNWETISSYSPCTNPIKIKCGDKLSMTAEYDLTKHQLYVSNITLRKHC